MFKIQEILRQEFPPSTVLIRDKMRQELGFVFREHRGYDTGLEEYIQTVYVDFYSEHAKSWFLIKFSEILDKKDSEIII